MADIDVSSSRRAGHVVVALRGELDVKLAAQRNYYMTGAPT